VRCVREAFHAELTSLEAELADMCELATTAMRQATQALLTADRVLAEHVLAADARLDQARDRCEEHAQQLLARQAPVAADLRGVLAAVYCADRLERMGDLAAHVADVACRHHPEPVVPEDLGGLLAELGRCAVDMAIQLSELLAEPRETGAGRLDRADEVMDVMHDVLLEAITASTWPHGITTAVDLALLGRYYERFADQAVSVARRHDFVATGTLKSSSWTPRPARHAPVGC
jgi:phosphate transport system protein